MSQDSEPHYDGEMLGIVAIIIICYSLRRAGAPPPNDDMHALAQAAKRKRRDVTGQIVGYVDYTVQACYRLHQVFDLRRDEMCNPFAPISARADLKHIDTIANLTMQEICTRHSVDLPNTFVPVCSSHAELIVKNLTTAVRVCAVSKKTRHAHLLPCGPPINDVNRWVRQMNSDDRERLAMPIDNARINIMLELPSGTLDNPQSGRAGVHGEQQYDAVEFLRWMRFTRHLHNQECVGDAADDGLDAALVGDTTQLERTRVPRKTSLMQGRMHLDATHMLLDRRFFKDLLTNRPDDLVAAFVYSDGSPVSGTELQGMVMDMIMRDRSIITRIMPGVALAYGAFGVMSKAFAFLWAIYLGIGPWEFGLTLFFTKVRGLTTDMGTELGLADVPNLIKGFLLYLLGKSMEVVQTTIDYETRFFFFAGRFGLQVGVTCLVV